MQATSNLSYASAFTPSYKLYDQRAVALATFLGSPAAGAWLLALNFRRMGRLLAATLSIGIGILVTIALVSLAYVMPKGTPSVIFWLPQIIGISYLAKRLQGRAIESHQSVGGLLASRWKAAGIGLASLGIIFAAIFAVILLQTTSPTLGTRVAIGTNDEIYYRGAATRQDALALGNALKTDGFLTDRGVSVLLSKGAEGTIVSFIVKDGVWDDATHVHNFEIIARSIAPSIGGLPMTVRLVNDQIETKKEMKVE